MLLVSCGGYSAPTGSTTSTLTKRAFISNRFTSRIDIVNAAADTLSANFISTDASPAIMSLSPDKLTTLVFASGSNRINVIGNKAETSAGSLQLVDTTESFFYLPDNNTVYVAVRNTGQVVKWDTKAGTTVGITVANARHIVRSNNGKYVLAFPDDSSNTVYFIDTTAATPTATAVTGFDRPVWAVFSSDDTVAYVLNCGPECGGATAGVQILNTPALTLGASVAVPGGATDALLSGSTLYVAGTPSPAPACVANLNSPTCGRLSVVSVSGAPSVSSSHEINDGYHDHMLMAANNRLFVGAEFTCTAIRPSGNGCLSIFNTSANTVAIPVVCGPSCGGLADVTGMSNISGRTVVYVIEGGEVHVYDTATDALKTGVSLDTTGRSWDVVSPD
jgi:DNA-binding beta-propeller fold protein YncE